MKRKSIISALIFCMTLGMVSTSCEDMLSPNSERHSYDVAGDTLYSYWGILKSLQNVAERYVILNECRADLVDGTEFISDSIAAIINFGQGEYADRIKDGSNMYLKASDYYHVINSCNAYIAKCDTVRLTGTNEPYMIKEYAQVQAIRAWVYMQLIYTYGRVPFYTKPLLKSDEINNFMNNPNRQMVDASNLADLLADELIPLEYVVEKYGYPQYNNYGDVSSGNSNFVCHSSKVMFPVSIVLGDMFLLKGDKASCAQAAQYYYNFLNSKYGGILIPNNYFSIANIEEGEEEPFYTYTGVPFRETGAASRTQESITCIPSNKGKLDGKVNTSINRLFGFEPTLSAGGNSEESTSNIGLNLNFDRELVASKGYEALCDSQKYEIYMGDHTDPYMEIVELPEVGDARRSWIMDQPSGQQYIGRVGEDMMYGKFVSKQNPNRGYCTTYPMIYRKSTIWLRYAEALNRAGFPSYAFAILKNGLCNNDYWYPTAEDYGVKDTAYYWVNTVDSLGFDTIPADYLTNPISTSEGLSELVYRTYNELNIDSADVEKNGKPGFEALSYNNYTQFFNSACYYIDKRELEVAQVTPYMNFKQQYLRGSISSMSLNYKISLYDRGYHNTKSYPETNLAEFYLTTGIHQRGCGMLRYDEKAQTGHESYFNYVDMVAKKIKENHGMDVTMEDIYGQGDANIQEYVVEAVEDLIIDEMAMELAFEGTRFPDLARVSMRRNDPTFLAKRVAMRSGKFDQNLYNHLSQSSNWYFPLPEE